MYKNFAVNLFLSVITNSDITLTQQKHLARTLARKTYSQRILFNGMLELAVQTTNCCLHFIFPIGASCQVFRGSFAVDQHSRIDSDF